ncbi:GNAT family N-acetyltransferase [Alkalicoccobacillus plakortidis]|uniref:GNAT family N-acetyltransferase n=1 Tax=Alkalicoccobacillus plakortidis TaxID=444060 RepID=A0ABT0XL62_9BACI|nr:GNAT family N-acetyltransferase [Alkalicoccobacillus plakortidis]MCM2676631.1 GNAT family N-acetyltransferase [Alkalicoccobacillus plakortidis]
MRIKLVSLQTVEKAKSIILDGLKERFSVFDTTYNTDLQDLLMSYNGEDRKLFIGEKQGEVVCTGALTKRSNHVVGIERVSVDIQWRNQGFAKRMISHLENEAHKQSYSKLIVETSDHWHSAIHLYKTCGYHEVQRKHNCIYFEKLLSQRRKYDEC